MPGSLLRARISTPGRPGRTIGIDWGVLTVGE